MGMLTSEEDFHRRGRKGMVMVDSIGLAVDGKTESTIFRGAWQRGS